MDLCVGAKRVIVAMEHCTKQGAPKLLKTCRLPLTCQQEINLVVTELAILEVTDIGFCLRALAPGVSFEQVQEKTEACLHITSPVGQMVP